MASDVLIAVGEAIAKASDRAGPAVVGRGRGWDVGSGFVLATGEVVVAGTGVRSTETFVTFGDGRREPARITATDSHTGLALLAVDTGDVAPLRWAAGDGATPGPGIGAPVVAIASPGGRGLRATLGFVASRAASLRGERGRRISGAIEHTAPLPRGSAGGPLVDLEGRLVGINLVRSAGGLIVALPAESVLQARIAALRDGGSLPRRELGVAVAPPRASRRLRAAVGLPDVDGLLVRAVEEGSAGDRAGLRQGDLITAVDGRPVDAVEILHAALDRLARDVVSLGVIRGAEEHELTVSFAAAGEADRDA